MARKKSDDSKPKSKSLFDHINEVRVGKNPKYFETLSEADKKSWSNYMVCRFLSMQSELVEFVHDIQKYSGILSPKDFYKMLIDYVPSGRAYVPYVKSASEKHSKEILLLLSIHFQDSERNVSEYVKILSDDDVSGIIKKYGYSQDQIEEMMKKS